MYRTTLHHGQPARSAQSQRIDLTWHICSSRYALRPYLYLLVHWPVAKVFSIMSEPHAASALAFYAVKSFLAAISWMLEARLVKYAFQAFGSTDNHVLNTPCLGLCRATRTKCGPTAAAVLAVLLAFSSGTFFASSAMLPSTFSMYCMISATTGVLTSNVPV